MATAESTPARRAFLDTLTSECRYAWRSLMATPGFTIVAIATLVVGIGANAAILSVADPLLLRPLPYPHADSLVALRSTNLAAGFPDDRTSLANLLDWQAQSRLFEAIAGYRWRSADLLGGDRSERLQGLVVTPEFFKVFGTGTVMGRTFARSDQSGTQPSIILGAGLWRRRFASDPSVVGGMLEVNTLNFARAGATPRRVLGAMTTDSHFPPFSADFQLHVAGLEDAVDFWMPEPIPRTPNRSARELDVVGLLRPGVTIAQAQTEMNGIAERLAQLDPAANQGWSIRVVPLREHILGSTRRVVLLLSLCSLVVLLIACVNVATLQLARGIARQRDVAIQVALGAGRARIFRQMLVESSLLALLAGVVAVLAAAWGLSLLRSFVPAGIPLIGSIGLDARVLLLTLGVTIVAALAVSIVPTVRAWLRNPASIMQADGRGLAPDRRRRRVLYGLIAAEVALTLTLLVAFGLMMRSAANVLRINPGFEADGLLTMTISLPSNKFEWKHNVVFSRQVIESVKSLAEIETAAVVQGVPMRTGSFYTTFLPDNGSPPPTDLPVARLRVISPGYFRTMRIPILAGRDFDQRDEIGQIGYAPQVIISKALAARYFPPQGALDRRLRMGDRWSTVVGIADDVRYAGMDRDPDVDIYLPEGLYPQAAITLLVRTRGEPRAAIADVRARVLEIDKDAFVTDVKPMAVLIAESLAQRRLATLLFTIFAVMALALALAGIYSVIAQSVLQRRFEIAIRLALGSEPQSVVRLIVSQTFLPALVGIGIGAMAAFVLARTLSTMLFQIRPSDPVTWLLVTVVMTATCLAASYLPARRAGVVEPGLALRAL